MSAERYDTLVIGAGMSGLAAGIRLAHFGQRVAVLERHYLWGGLNSFFKRGGRRYDVGLHALTNWCRPGERGKPLTKVLKQLRLSHRDLRLGEQTFSEIAFPGARLRFSNDFELLRAEIGAAFPRRRDAFERLVRAVDAHELAGETGDAPFRSTRAVLRELLAEPLLEEMLLLPTCYYGSAREDDIDWETFVILFRSLLQEGFARPAGGIKPLLDLLVARLRDAGGELRLQSGVARVEHTGGRATGVVLDDGTRLAADCILSSAGWLETLRLCGAELERAAARPEEAGRMSFVEATAILDRPSKALGIDSTIVFFNDAERLLYRRPDGLVEPRSGVICTPDNYATDPPHPEGVFRLTLAASHPRWAALDDEAYARAKQESVAAGLDVAARYVTDPRPHTLVQDVFTPRTIERFTGHLGGAVYGAGTKRATGRTPLEGLYLCGTDQGLLGIVGAMLSGVLMANRWALAPAAKGGA